ncbi:MATE family efflux transporter [Blautia hansenii]|uniref:MATE family efflux transporter n=1 Tax=Blautia hansenii TaxID=1322 RepID=A0ABX2I4S0_BLAHA|nr:MATE family efflux transporter [Blautia hansenii]MCB5599825.1 MATE family efflux transporter [Blautia hansenii]NSJ85443.1 MATE family efflux transporter [Blautia hansenii]
MVLKRSMSLEDKRFYSNVARLVMPMAIQNLINVGVTSTDVIMLGKVGETALSGVSLANQVYFILSLLFFGLTSGACVLTAQYWGKKDTRTIEKVMGMSFRISLLAVAVFTLAALVFPALLMRIFTTDQAVIEAGVSYLRIVAFSYMLSAFTNVYLNIIRSVEKVVIATVVYGTSLLANIIFNAIFIFGLLGVPAMGAAGAALGTLLARTIEVLIVVFYAVKMNDVVKIRWRDFFVKDKALGKDFFTYAFPVLLNELAWGAGMAAISAIVGHLGSSAVAAHSVAQVCRQLSMVIGFGISSAAAIMIGKAIGEKKEELAREYGRRFVKIAVLCGIGGGLLILGISPLVKSLLNLTPLAKSYLTAMMLIMSYYVVGQSVNTTMIVGIFRAGGDTRFGLILDVSVMWLCSILGSAVGAFVLGIPMPWVYILLCSDEIIKIPFSVYRYKTYKWLRNVTR